MAKRKRSAFSCKSRSRRRPSPRLSASRGPPFTALSRQGGYAHILKGYFCTNLVGTPLGRDPVSIRSCPGECTRPAHYSGCPLAGGELATDRGALRMRFRRFPARDHSYPDPGLLSYLLPRSPAAPFPNSHTPPEREN